MELSSAIQVILFNYLRSHNIDYGISEICPLISSERESLYTGLERDVVVQLHLVFNALLIFPGP